MPSSDVLLGFFIIIQFMIQLQTAFAITPPGTGSLNISTIPSSIGVNSSIGISAIVDVSDTKGGNPNLDLWVSLIITLIRPDGTPDPTVAGINTDDVGRSNLTDTRCGNPLNSATFTTPCYCNSLVAGIAESWYVADVGK